MIPINLTQVQEMQRKHNPTLLGNLRGLSFHLCSLGVPLGQLTATFRAHCRFVSVLVHVVTGGVLTSPPSTSCGQSQILKGQGRAWITHRSR